MKKTTFFLLFLTFLFYFNKPTNHHHQMITSNKSKRQVFASSFFFFPFSWIMAPSTSSSSTSSSSSVTLSFHDLSPEAIKKLTPSEALLCHLENAQLAHRVCVARALKEEVEPVDRCALTWGEVQQRYRQWAEYRPPFHDAAAQEKWTKFWTPKRQKAADAA